jgi:hypothetical protein
MSYTVTYEADVPVAALGALLEFEETIQEFPGGPEWVYAGGAINFPERQLGKQHNTYRYVQSGSAVGLLSVPRVPPPIWPFALTRLFKTSKFSVENIFVDIIFIVFILSKFSKIFLKINIF